MLDLNVLYLQTFHNCSFYFASQVKQNRPCTTANDVETLNFDLSAADASEAEDRDKTMVCHRQFNCTVL